MWVWRVLAALLGFLLIWPGLCFIIVGTVTFGQDSPFVIGGSGQVALLIGVAIMAAAIFLLWKGK